VTKNVQNSTLDTNALFNVKIGSLEPRISRIKRIFEKDKIKDRLNPAGTLGTAPRVQGAQHRRKKEKTELS